MNSHGLWAAKHYVDDMLKAIPNQTPFRQPIVTIQADDRNALAATQWACQLRLRNIPVVLTPEAGTGQTGFLPIGHDGSARIGDMNYSLSQIDLLVDTLSERTDEQ
jgi:hypothetical protein